MNSNEIKLIVAEPIKDDVNKGLVRIGTSFMNELGLKVGEMVELKGKKITVARVDRAYPGDMGLKIIRMDAKTRLNLDVKVGELVKLNKTKN